MLTALWSFLGVAYCNWLFSFCAPDLFDRAGDNTACDVDVLGWSCEDNALCRLGGTADAASSSILGRFSAVLVAVAAGLLLGVGVDVAEVSGRRAAIFGIGFGFLTGSSTILVRILTGDSFGGSWRSFFSGRARFGGKRSTCLTVANFAFENFSLTINVSFSSVVAGGAT